MAEIGLPKDSATKTRLELGGGRGVGARGPAPNLDARSKDLEKTLEKKLRAKT